MVPSIGVVYFVIEQENGPRRSYGPPRRLKFEEAVYFNKLIGALLHSNYTKMPPWVSLLSDPNEKMGLGGAMIRLEG